MACLHDYTISTSNTPTHVVDDGIAFLTLAQQLVLGTSPLASTWQIFHENKVLTTMGTTIKKRLIRQPTLGNAHPPHCRALTSLALHFVVVLISYS